MRQLKDLPNDQGFEFIGVRFDLSHVKCIVVQSVDAGFIVIERQHGKRVFKELKGWLPEYDGAQSL